MSLINCKSIVITVLIVMAPAFIYAQQVVSLYNGKAPGSEKWTWNQVESADNIFKTNIAYNVSSPSLTAYLPLPSAATGTAIIIAPGGAFHTLSIDNEGTWVAKWLNQKGIAAFVLKYRLVKSETSDPAKEMMDLLAAGNNNKLDSINAPIVSLALADGLAAVKYLRTHASAYHINPAKIGFMGFSAGGTLTMSVAYSATDESRPNFVAPIYAYEKAIIGSIVPKPRTPIFIAAASDDNLGFATHSVNIYLKWLAAKQPAEIHMYQRGGHGFGMQKNNVTADHWTAQFADWLKLNAYCK